MDNNELQSALDYGNAGTVDYDDDHYTDSGYDDLTFEAYVYSNFASLQRSLDCAASSALGAEGHSSCAFDVGVSPYPTPEYKNDYSTMSGISSIIPLYFVIAFVNSVGYIAGSVVQEKEEKLLEAMSMMGMRRIAYWLSWQMTLTVVAFVTCTLATIMIYVLGIFPATNQQPSGVVLIFLLLFLYNCTLVPFAFFLSTFINNSKAAGFTASFASMISSSVIFGLSGVTSQPARLGLALLSPLAFSQALSTVVELEIQGLGLGIDTIFDSAGTGFNFLRGIEMLIVDWFFYLFLAWYLGQVLAGEYGVAKHPLFCIFPDDSPVLVNIRQSMASSQGEGGSQAEQGGAAYSPLISSDAEGGSGPAGEAAPGDEAGESTLIEPVSEALRRAAGSRVVSVQSLTKTYPAKAGSTEEVKALSGLTFDMMGGQIFALLGQNGAGKSTAISIMTGLIKATEGSATIMGYPIHSHMDSIRGIMGVCPQHDTLFKQMTVWENMVLFSSLKRSRNGPGATMELERRVLDDLGLSTKLESDAESLSGGQKRALSVAIALIGDPEFLVLDEPTAGMDPVSRRRVWNLLSSSKGNRVTLLTTHFLDEADVLGDRIAIMSAGKVKAMGSPLFLKRRFGVGYHLNVISMAPSQAGAEDFSVDKVFDLITSHASNASIVGDQATDGNALEEKDGAAAGSQEHHFTIPIEQGGASGDAGSEEEKVGVETKFMGRLLLDLDQQLGSLGLTGYGVSMTTLDEVFISLTRAGGEGRNSSTAAVDTIRTSLQNTERGQRGMAASTDALSRRPTEPATALTQFQVLVKNQLKRKLRGNFKTNLFGMIFPAAMVFASLLMIKYADNSGGDDDNGMTSVYLSALTERFKTSNMYWASDRSAQENLPSCISSLDYKHTPVFVDNGRIGLQETLIDDMQNSRSKPTYASFLLGQNHSEPMCNDGGVLNTNWTLHYNSTTVNALPGFLSLLDSVTLFGSADVIKVTAEPFGTTSSYASGAGTVIAVANLIIIGFAPPLTVYAYESAIDKEKGLSHQLRVMGIPMSVIVSSSLVVDFMRWVVPSALTVITIAIFNITELLNDGAWFTVLFVFLCVGLEVVLQAYVVGQFQTSNAITTGIPILLLLGNYFFYEMSWTLLPLLHVDTYPYVAEQYTGLALFFFFVGGLLFPPTLIASLFYIVLEINFFGTDYPSSGAVYWAWTTDCPASFGDDDDMSIVCFGALPLILTALVGSAIYFFILTTLHCGSNRAKDEGDSSNQSLMGDWIQRVSETVKSVSAGVGSGDSVQRIGNERQRVYSCYQELTSGPYSQPDAGGAGSGTGTDQDVVLVKDLRKVFPAVKGVCCSKAKPEKTAVQGVSLGIRVGECFGLLGPNGAGKTTLISMLTGVTPPTAGDALVSGHSLTEDLGSVLQDTGFCPQFNGLWDELTVREHIETYAKLRGVAPKAAVDALTLAVEEVLNMREYTNRQSRDLSGGNKRKLSGALALLGGPPIVYLDEPSTGVDVSTRRHLWALIRANTTQRATILTTHSMEEAEILSDRIGIMAKGALRALGTCQELKNEFGADYQLDLQVQSAEEAQSSIRSNTSNGSSRSGGAGAAEGASQAVLAVQEFLTARYPTSRLVEHNADALRFLIPASDLTSTIAAPDTSALTRDLESDQLDPKLTLAKKSALDAIATAAAAVEEAGGKRGLGAAFLTFESVQDVLNIAEFSLSQTTLEQVFLRIAKESAENDNNEDGNEN